MLVDEFFVHAAFNNAHVFHYQDLIRVHDGGQTMGHHQGGMIGGNPPSSAWMNFSVFESRVEVASSNTRMRGFFSWNWPRLLDPLELRGAPLYGASA
jgi:hypothetical protein